jgi:hypothetical protein
MQSDELPTLETSKVLWMQKQQDKKQAKTFRLSIMLSRNYQIQKSFRKKLSKTLGKETSKTKTEKLIITMEQLKQMKSKL